jgi:uncharacterized protein YbcI
VRPQARGARRHPKNTGTVADEFDIKENEGALAEEMLRLHEEAYGKGASEARILSDENTIVVILDGLELQRSEEFLIDAGYGDRVIQNRTLFQQAIETTFRAAVERATGRRVVSFSSSTRVDPTYAIEVFRLGERMADVGIEQT